MFLLILILLINICCSLLTVFIVLRCRNLIVLIVLLGALCYLDIGIGLIMSDKFVGCFFILIGLIAFAILISDFQYLERWGFSGIDSFSVFFHGVSQNFQNGNVKYYLLYFILFFWVVVNISYLLYSSIITSVFLVMELLS